PISVTTPAGTATSGTFTVTAAPEVTVSIAPQIQGYVVGQTKQFTATVTCNTNTAVTWSSTPAGLVSTTGLFTAPASATTSVTITATSAADTSKSASLSFPVRDRNLNTQGSVDVVDLATLSKYYGATGLAVGDAASCCDLNGDGKVDDDDITLFFLGF
ncbi:MAG TPA: Ig-like domain-containing protein, partial [Holophaga sp.]|nr:Ig-like domain-containing protein [Holophaga sp.]